MGEVYLERTSKFWIDDDGIIRGVFMPGYEFELEDAKSMFVLHRKITGGTPACLLMDITPIKSLRREVRAYFTQPEHAEVHRAVAMIVTSPLSRAVGNFFLGLNKPAMPMKLFNHEEPALDWLRTFAQVPPAADPRKPR